jgi:hypothetical protein
MARIEDLFVLHRARSGLFSEYEPGDVAYVGNGFADNGVVGYVNPRPKDLVFDFEAIAVSAFCEATVQVPPFIACGRAGNGLVVLQPRGRMTLGQLAFLAAYINATLRWRFNWYHQITADRLRRLPLPDSVPSGLGFDVRRVLPQPTISAPAEWRATFSRFALDDLFELEAGHFHSLGELEPGDVPVVSCGDRNNGIVGRYDVKEHLHRGRLTIALNGSTLATKYHPYTFAAKDDAAICIPKQPMRLTSELFIQAVLTMERWRYSYYRKCYISKLRRFSVSVPSIDGWLDEDAMASMVERAPYWAYVQQWGLQPARAGGD